MKLTMLVAECQPAFEDRIDVVFKKLLVFMRDRLRRDRIIKNLAHPDKPALTKTAAEQNVIDLEAKLDEALKHLAELDKAANENADAAREAWDWVFQSDGYFAEFDKQKKDDEKRKALMDKAELIANSARTSPAGVIGMSGVSNQPHKFYGDNEVLPKD
jgi:hypothetical protein